MGYIEELRKAVGSRPLIMVGAGVLILNQEGKLLLLRRTDNQTWSIPGGAMEPGETFEETARREIEEETGLKLGDLSFYHLFSGPETHYRYPNGDEVYNVSVVFLTRQAQGKLRVDPQENSEARYFDVDEIPEQISPPVVPVIERFKQTHTKKKRYGLPGFGGNA